MAYRHFETAGKRISSGLNINVATLPAQRVVGYATSALSSDAIDALSVVGAAKIKGVTLNAIPTGEVGDVACEDGTVVPIDTTAAAVAVGDKLTVEAATGKVLTAAPAAGVNAEIVGVAESAVGGAGGVVMARLHRFTMQG